MFKRDIATWTRWLHIYASMFSFTVLLFFAATGITLNHPDWFIGRMNSHSSSGTLASAWVHGTDTASIRKLEIVEYLRTQHHITAPLVNFIAEESQCTISFKGPGYSADAFIDRSDSSYELTVISPGWVAVMNDLHKARDTKSGWSIIIDISAVLMIVVSITGFIMIFYLKKKRTGGLLVFAIGTFLFVLLYYAFA